MRVNQFLTAAKASEWQNVDVNPGLLRARPVRFPSSHEEGQSGKGPEGLGLISFHFFSS